MLSKYTQQKTDFRGNANGHHIKKRFLLSTVHGKGWIKNVKQVSVQQDPWYLVTL
jgi:hypothetical protein